MYRLVEILSIFLIFGIVSTIMPFFESPQDQDFFGIEEIELPKNNLVFVQENSLLSNLNPSNRLENEKMTVIATAYSSSPWETWGNPYITASNTWVRKGIIANNLLPFGTEIKIPELYGDEIFVVEDRMHYRKGYYHIDIWFPSYWEAKNFGAKTTYIEILET